jgi:hypothetical protein
MDDEQRQHLEKLRQTHLFRLRHSEQRAAQLGINTPPDVLMEIEDDRAKIAGIEAELGAYRPQTDASRRREKLVATSAVLVGAGSAIEAIFMDTDNAEAKVLLDIIRAAQQTVKVFVERC